MNSFDCAIITPCYNENSTVIEFLQQLEKVVTATPINCLVIIVNDASNDNTLKLLRELTFSSDRITKKVISLKYNVGHQLAIYNGLLYASGFKSKKYIVIDSDGQDDPAAIQELINIENNDIVFVSRRKRNESLIFKLCYFAYRLLFRIIAGKKINFGNYSMISDSVMDIIKDRPFIHYAAFLSKLKVRYTTISYDRKKRAGGKSKMGMKRLMVHGLKSLIEYSEELLFLFLKIFVLLAIALFISICIVIYIKLFTDKAIPGWASSLTLMLFNSMLISLGFFVIGLMQANIAKNQEHQNKVIYTEVD